MRCPVVFPSCAVVCGRFCTVVVVILVAEVRTGPKRGLTIVKSLQNTNVRAFDHVICAAAQPLGLVDRVGEGDNSDCVDGCGGYFEGCLEVETNDQ